MSLKRSNDYKTTLNSLLTRETDATTTPLRRIQSQVKPRSLQHPGLQLWTSRINENYECWLATSRRH